MSIKSRDVEINNTINIYYKVALPLEECVRNYIVAKTNVMLVNVMFLKLNFYQA